MDPYCNGDRTIGTHNIEMHLRNSAINLEGIKLIRREVLATRAMMAAKRSPGRLYDGNPSTSS